MTATKPNQVMNSIRLVAIASSVASARQFTSLTLRQWHFSALAEKAELLVSELVTNAVKQTGSTDPELHLAVMATLPHVAVQLSAIGRAVRTEVWDCSPEIPSVQRQDTDATNGRGLFLVQALSER